jgi:CubicO group peptidase (beta-lactamase class C family)
VYAISRVICGRAERVRQICPAAEHFISLPSALEALGDGAMRAALVRWVSVLLAFTSYCDPLEVPARPSGRGAGTSEASSQSGSEPWAKKMPTDVGLDPTLLTALSERLRANPELNMHAVLIVKDGALVFEQYLQGRDESWGDDLGVVRFDRETLHDMRSTTKSVVSALVGIAIGDGAIRGADAPVVDLLPEPRITDREAKRSILLRHVLTMMAGLEWDESMPYTDPRNSERLMIRSGDPIGYVLSRKLVSEPGRQFNYNGGLTELLAAVVRHGTGNSLEEFARERLFAPLGIERFEWRRHANGLPSAASGLRLRPVDLAKFGYLYLNRGRWNSDQILPASWVDQSLREHWSAPHFGYGYQWWVPRFTAEGTPIEAFNTRGNGGQCAFVFPTLGLVVVTTAGNYNQFEGQRQFIPHQLIAEYVLPAAGVKDVELVLRN